MSTPQRWFLNLARNYILMLGLALALHFPGNMESSWNVVSAYANCYSHPTEGFSCLCLFLFPFLSLSLCVCVHVLCHNGTWVLHKMCSVVFFCYFFALWQTELVSPAFRAFHAVTLHPAIWIIYSCYCYCVLFVGFCSLWFFCFSLEASQEQEGRGGRVKWKQPQQRENAGKVFLAAFRIAPFGPTNLCVQFVAKLAPLLQLLIIAHNSSTPNEMPDCTCNLRP